MAVENGYGTGLDMVVDEENNENNLENEKEDDETEKKSIDVVNCDKTKEDETTVAMEVVEVQENDPLESTDDNQGEEPKKEDELPPEPVVTEYVNEFSGTIISNNNSNSSTSNSVPIEPIVKIKEEPSEIVLIDSEDEKEEKPKVKSIPTRSVQLRQNPKPAANRVSAGSVSSTANPVGHSRGNNGDFQIVSVDDDSPMNKNDPMNVFLCSTEEREFRKDYFKDPSSNVLKQRLHCTICDIHIGACPQNSKNMVCHRFLKVLICRKCANFYGQGEFPQDEGSDEFCRWCGEGGEVFLCNSCSNVFCQACILRNFGMQEIKRVDRLDNWDCYVCDTRPLWTLRAIAFALFTYVRRIKVVAYRNGMYQTINTSNAKVSKSDLMALETDLSTCCPKEVKAAAAAASNPPPSEIEIPKAPPVVSNVSVKPKDNKAPSVPPSRSSGPVKGTVQGKVVDGLVQYIHSDVPVQSSPVQQVYNQPATRSSKRSKPPPKQLSPAPAPWQQPQVLPDYFASPGKRVGPPPPFGMPQSPVLFPQSTLRSALVGQPGAFMPSPQQILPNSFGGPNHMMVYGNKEGQSEPNVLHWFNGILSSLMDTVKNIDNRLVFIRNSTSNLISQNEVSFLVNQLHNLLKVSCSKMQEVDCDLLKNYKEFIDKSEITVNDFDDIVREFPEFFKPGTEGSPNHEEPESNNDTEPDPPDDFNPMALVEVIEEGDQQPHSTAALSKSDAASKSKKSISAKDNGNSKKSSNKSSSDTQRCTLTIKKETITLPGVSDGASSLEGDASGKNKTTNGSVKRKLEDSASGNSTNKSKVRVFETVHIKQEKEDDSENSSELQQTSDENSSVNSTNVLVSSVSESDS